MKNSDCPPACESYTNHLHMTIEEAMAYFRRLSEVGQVFPGVELTLTCAEFARSGVVDTLIGQTGVKLFQDIDNYRTTLLPITGKSWIVGLQASPVTRANGVTIQFTENDGATVTAPGNSVRWHFAPNEVLTMVFAAYFRTLVDYVRNSYTREEQAHVAFIHEVLL